MDFKSINFRQWIFIILALCFQIVSFYASFEGIKETFISQTFFAFVFAFALNLSLLAGWHEFQQNHDAKPEDGLAKRKSLALLIGSILLCLSAFLSSIGMYSVLGYGRGSESDSIAEYSQSFQQTKDIFFKVKDAAAKNIDLQKADIVKKLDAAKKRLAQIKLEKNKAAAAESVRQLEAKNKSLDDEKSKIASQKPLANENLTPKQRNIEIQTQISNLISEYEIERDKVLSESDKKILAFDAPISRNMYDQFVFDLQNKKPLAIASIAFGIAPDLLAIALMFIGTPRKKLWLRIRDAKIWTVRLGREIIAPVDITVAAAVEVVVNDDNRNPLAQFSLPIDFNEEISEDHIREFFPQIITALTGHFGGSFIIRDLPANWRELLTAGEPLELTAVEA